MKRDMKKGVRLLLSLVAIFIVAQVAVPREVQATEQAVSVESWLLDANHERDYISERNTRTAVPAEFSSRIVPPTVRTQVWRSRTHTSCAISNNNLLAAGNHNWQRAQTTGISPLTRFASRAADYYIFALRHIII